MPSDIDNIVATFPYPTVPTIEGLPTFSTIKALHLKLNANAASVQSNLGDGNQGLIYLTVSDAVYATLSDVEFIEPLNPGTTPVYAARATAAQISQTRTDFIENRKNFNQYNNTDKALKQLLLSAVDDMFLKTLKNSISGYSRVTTKQLINHLYDRYGQLTPQDLKDNDDNLHQPYDATSPIENLFEQIETAQDIATTAGAQYNNTQILNAAYNLVFNTNAFPDSCREWRRLPQAQKTWLNFKLIFTEAHKDYMMLQSQGNHRFHAANATQEPQDDYANTAEALANLASATASDRAAMANLTSTNEKLTEHIENLSKQLSTALQKITSLEQSAKQQISVPAGTPSTQNRPKRQIQQKYYCWTHGFKVRTDGSHTSMTCTRRRPGHQENATATNRMGGYEAGMIRKNE